MILRRIKIYFTLAILIAAVSCGNKKQQTQGPPPVASVTVNTVETSTALYYDEYPATVNALNQIDLRPQVSGFITGIYFQDGAHVTKGQKLYTIDEQQYAANYQQALANLAVQETNLSKAQKDADRYHQLDQQDAIAKQQVDYADAALDAAKKQVEAAKANVRSVQTSVRYTIIEAPFTGTIGISLVKLGSPVTAGTTVLNTVSTDEPMAVDFAINQSELYRFSQLSAKGANPKDSTFSLAFGDSIYTAFGHISVIDRAVDPQTGTIKIRLTFPNEHKILKAGMTGVVRVLNSANQTVIIPYKAVTEQLGEFFVYVINDSNKATQTKIITGRQIGDKIIVRNGLQAGQKIAVQGVQNLKEGSAVKPITDSTQKK